MRLYTLILLLSYSLTLFAQEMPSIGENVSCLVTFGKDAKTSYGDDDFSQTVFLMVPSSHSAPIFIRLFDPDISGDLDEINGEINRKDFGLTWGAITEAGKIVVSDTVKMTIDAQFVKQA